MKELKEEMSQISTFKEAQDYVKNHVNSIDDMERQLRRKKESVYIDVCLILVSIYFGLLPLLQLYFYETSKLTYALLGVLWVIPLILIIIDIKSLRKKRIAWEYLFLAIYDYRQNHSQESC